MAGKRKSGGAPTTGSRRVTAPASSPSASSRAASSRAASSRAAPSRAASPRAASSSRAAPSRPASPRSSRAAATSNGKYKLLALDLDGTLLNHAGAANDIDLAAIRKLKAHGIKVTILTGRLYSGTRESAELLGIEGPVGCADGSHIVNVKNDKTLLHHGIRGRAADRLRTSLERNDLVAFLFAEDAIVHDERGADYLPYVRTWSTDLRYAHRVTEHALWDSDRGMTAVVALGKEANIGRTVADIQRDTTEAMQVAMFPFRRDPERWGLVARASGGTKGTALEWVSAHYGLDISETVCVGDWLNDLPMMTKAGRSFAMGQAPDEVKSSATDVLVNTIDAGGAIAEAIHRAFGIRH